MSFEKLMKASGTSATTGQCLNLLAGLAVTPAPAPIVNGVMNASQRVEESIQGYFSLFYDLSALLRLCSQLSVVMGKPCNSWNDSKFIGRLHSREGCEF